MNAPRVDGRIIDRLLDLGASRVTVERISQQDIDDEERLNATPLEHPETVKYLLIEDEYEGYRALYEQVVISARLRDAGWDAESAEREARIVQADPGFDAVMAAEPKQPGKDQKQVGRVNPSLVFPRVVPR